MFFSRIASSISPRPIPRRFAIFTRSAAVAPLLQAERTLLRVASRSGPAWSRMASAISSRCLRRSFPRSKNSSGPSSAGSFAPIVPSGPVDPRSPGSSSCANPSSFEAAGSPALSRRRRLENCQGRRPPSRATRRRMMTVELAAIAVEATMTSSALSVRAGSAAFAAPEESSFVGEARAPISGSAKATG